MLFLVLFFLHEQVQIYGSVLRVCGKDLRQLCCFFKMSLHCLEQRTDSTTRGSARGGCNGTNPDLRIILPAL